MSEERTMHTKGPWIAETNEKSGTITILGARDDGNARLSDGLGELVTVDCDPLGEGRMFPPMNPQDVANARLIAAAPDLLAALEDALVWLAQDDTPQGQAYAERARSAIKAATGAA